MPVTYDFGLNISVFSFFFLTASLCLYFVRQTLFLGVVQNFRNTSICLCSLWWDQDIKNIPKFREETERSNVQMEERKTMWYPWDAYCKPFHFFPSVCTALNCSSWEREFWEYCMCGWFHYTCLIKGMVSPPTLLYSHPPHLFLPSPLLTLPGLIHGVQWSRLDTLGASSIPPVPLPMQWNTDPI